MNVQVRSRSGEYVRVPIVPGAVLINIADLMQRWTCDQFVSVVSSGDGLHSSRFVNEEVWCLFYNKVRNIILKRMTGCARQLNNSNQYIR